VSATAAPVVMPSDVDQTLVHSGGSEAGNVPENREANPSEPSTAKLHQPYPVPLDRSTDEGRP